jgi:hypothetical protein
MPTSPLHAVTSLRAEAVASWPQAESWRVAGLVPVVLSGLPASLGGVNGVCTVPWEKPLAWHGRKLATMVDCLQVSDRLNEQRGALVLNADIYLGLGFPAVLDEALASEGPVLFTRWEIARWPETSNAQPNEFGWDGVWIPHAHLCHFQSHRLALGLPWWDYWIPYKALRLGLSLTVVSRKVCFHETHPEVWQEREQRELCSAVWKDLGYGPIWRKLHHLFAPKAERKFYGYWNHLAGEIRRRIRKEARFIE